MLAAVQWARDSQVADGASSRMTMPGADLLKALEAGITAERLFPPNARIVVGVSGGADSMCLLHALLALNGRSGFDLDLHVAHLNHQLRGEDADADAA
ncbi:MAG: ATP-binding protein, partial [Planctomycetota bacterium]